MIPTRYPSVFLWEASMPSNVIALLYTNHEWLAMCPRDESILSQCQMCLTR